MFFMLLACGLARGERAQSPFGPKGSVDTQSGVVRFDFNIPAEHVIYADKLHFLNDQGDELKPSKIPAPITAIDKFSKHEKQLYNQSFAAELKLDATRPLTMVVKFQGCSNSACYFPEKHTFVINDKNAIAEVSPNVPPPETVADAGSADWAAEAKQFKVVAHKTGYVAAGDFVSFLKNAETGGADSENDPLARFRKTGMLVTLILIIVGGLGLNMTPCVLPLIPINLAIIGAGKTAPTRREGFFKGAIYGAGMAIAYGLLGVAVVLTGAKFGTLNSSIWFNALIAIVFVVLSLGMFGKVNVDFSRYDGSLSAKLRSFQSHSAVAFGLGGMSALLAGACVAPVVISVLLLSANLYAKGMVVGLMLPFLLGVGMALPWPLAGASMSFLPKPGNWMTYVKYIFGVLILVFAIYYGHLAYGLYRTQHASTSLADAPGSAGANADARQALLAAMREASASGKPVLIDFQASWCKNCTAMDETVFNQTAVQQQMKNFVAVKFQAERPNESPAREVLDHFGVMGLPTYVVLSKPN